MNIIELVKNGESQAVEFIEVVAAPQKLARIISSFSNTDGGTILIGVREPNIIVGVAPDKFTRAYQQAASLITGLAKNSSEVVEFDGKTIGVITVEKAASPVGSSDGYFTRIGEMDLALRPEQLTQLFTKEAGAYSAIESLSQTVSKQTDEIETGSHLKRQTLGGESSFMVCLVRWSRELLS